MNDIGKILHSNKDEKLKNTVITNLHTMIQMLTTVITVFPPHIEDEQIKTLWKRLEKEGILGEKLLRYLWQTENRDHFEIFIEVMRVFRLIYEKKGLQEGNREFLVPCRMKVDNDTSLEVTKDDRQMVSVYLTPKDFLPDAVYHTLVAAFLELTDCDNSQVFRNRSDFSFEGHRVSLGAVKITRENEKPHAIKLEIFCLTIGHYSTSTNATTTLSEPKLEPSICRKVLNYLRNQLKTVCNIYEGSGYNLRVLCDACNPNDHHLIDLEKCLTNDTVQCNRMKSMDTTHIRHCFLSEPVSMPSQAHESVPQLVPTPVPEPVIVPDSELSQTIEPVVSNAGSIEKKVHEGASFDHRSHTSKESAEKEFQTMLLQVSTWCDHHDLLHKLKVLCNDMITDFSDLQNAGSTIELFNVLKRCGHLTVTNFKVLIDAINVTGSNGVLEVNKLLKDTYDEDDHYVNSFSPYRQRLIKFGKALSEDNITTLTHLKGFSKKQRKNQWTMILDLERRRIITEEGLPSFINDLKENGMSVAAEKLEDPI
ncbi:uncharacterized protein [Antedon mediterranea]|uniref:uncharacterized protein n=1 Tax=Antedon mediterranea TaxID=105859 RepID=UPI003AF4C31D